MGKMLSLAKAAIFYLKLEADATEEIISQARQFGFPVLGNIPACEIIPSCENIN